MTIGAVVTRGYASGGSIALVVTRGYVPGAVVTTVGGAGGPTVYWQGKRKKRRLEKRPLDLILSKVSEYYQEIVSSDLPKAVKKEAAEVVKPFVQKPTKGIPKVETVDWTALRRNADAMGLLLQIWKEELLAKEIEDEDELMMFD